jgi:hypothetical protein
MIHHCKSTSIALLVLGLAGLAPAIAGGNHYDASCGCMRPDREYTTTKYVREAPRLVTHERIINHTRVVRGSAKLIQENRVTVHVRPVIDREVIVHRTNTIVEDELLHRVNPITLVRNEYHRETVVRYVEGSVRHVLERREVPICGCSSKRGLFGNVVKYRD